MLYARVQLVAPSVATWAPSATSWLAPDSMPCIAASDSLTPPAQDSLAVFMSCRNPRRSEARSGCDGRCTRASATVMTSTTAPATQNSRGERRVAHPVGRTGTYPGCVHGGDCTCSAPILVVDQRGVGGQFRHGHVAEDPLDDVMAGVQEEGLWDAFPAHAVRVRHRLGGLEADRVPDPVIGDEMTRRRGAVVRVHTDDHGPARRRAVEAGQRGRLAFARAAPGREKVHDHRAPAVGA